MKKIDTPFIIAQYQSGVDNYAQYTTQVGLWESEQHVFQKYLKTSDHILDLGCGTGRTTFALYHLGFCNLIGVDLTPEMIVSAQQLNGHFNVNIDFQVGDACALTFAKDHFDAVIFSFNGLMSIPGQSKRDRALAEINRIMKPNGTFIFTTHDRDREPQFFDFWKEEKVKWDHGDQDSALHEFGDIIAHSKNESRKIFIHIPNQEEIKTWLEVNGFQVTETFYRSDRFQENAEVLKKSGECRFWIARKISE